GHEPHARILDALAVDPHGALADLAHGLTRARDETSGLQRLREPDLSVGRLHGHCRDRLRHCALLETGDELGARPGAAACAVEAIDDFDPEIELGIARVASAIDLDA